MTVRPILFSAPMVRALLDGRKTQTRRILKPSPDLRVTEVIVRDDGKWGGFGPAKLPAPPPQWNAWRALPFFDGDVLWVRETWAVSSIYDGLPPRELNPNGIPNYCGVRYAATDERLGIKNRPGIHMPRWASRLTLEVTGVKVERLQDISEADAEAEGASAIDEVFDMRPGWSMDWSERHDDPRAIALQSARFAFGNYWNRVHAGPNWNLKPEGSEPWVKNPWVVAVTFDVHKQNVDAFLKQREAA